MRVQKQCHCGRIAYERSRRAPSTSTMSRLPNPDRLDVLGERAGARRRPFAS
jgi:hypothetical protein